MREDARYIVRGRVVEWDASRVRQNADVLTAWDAINADGRVVAGSGLLSDNGQSDFEVPGNDVRLLAHALTVRLPKIRAVAILVMSTLHYGMARQFEAFADSRGVEIQVFRKIEAARKWLDERIASPDRAP